MSSSSDCWTAWRGRRRQQTPLPPPWQGGRRHTRRWAAGLERRGCCALYRVLIALVLPFPMAATLTSACLQLRELDALSDEQQRDAMQRLVDDVSQGWGPPASGLQPACMAACDMPRRSALLPAAWLRCLPHCLVNPRCASLWGLVSARSSPLLIPPTSPCHAHGMRRTLHGRCMPRASSQERTGRCASSCASWTAAAPPQSAAAWCRWGSAAAARAASQRRCGRCSCRCAAAGRCVASHPQRHTGLHSPGAAKPGCLVVRASVRASASSAPLCPLPTPQVKQLLSQEERLAAQAAADRVEGAGREAALSPAAGAEAEGQPAEGEGSAAGMLQSAVELLEQAQGLLEQAEGQARRGCPAACAAAACTARCERPRSALPTGVPNARASCQHAQAGTSS